MKTSPPIIDEETIRPKLINFVIVLLIAIPIIFSAVGVAGNQDPLWFVGYFDETPARMIVSKEGCQVELLSGQPGFEELRQGLNQSFSHVIGWNWGLGLSPDTLKQYREQGPAVEVFYSKPVTIHSAYSFGHPDSIFIPLSDYFVEWNAIFGGHDGNYWAGSLRLGSLEPIQRAFKDIPCVK